jgi:hypothetical protein
MEKFNATRRSGAGRLSCALFIAATLGAISPLPARAADMEVNIDNFTFTPKELTVKAGTTVVFRNKTTFRMSSLEPRVSSILRRSIPATVSRSPSPKPDLTAISAARIRKCKARSSSRREPPRIIISA